MLAALALFSSGCTSTYNDNWFNHNNNECCFDSLFTGWRDHVWAKRAYHRCYPVCDHLHASHFRRGFMAGYGAVCEGQDTYLPAVAPEEYWGYRYQTAEGSHMVNAWFEGYPEGVRAANEDGAGSYRNLQIPASYNELIDPSTNAWDAYTNPDIEDLPPVLPASESDIGPSPDLPADASYSNPTESDPTYSTQPVDGSYESAPTIRSNAPLSTGQRLFPWGMMR